jgi:hypothetical protein
MSLRSAAIHESQGQRQCTIISRGIPRDDGTVSLHSGVTTDKKNSFTYQDGYQDVTDSELKDLLEMSRGLMSSLEAEVKIRHLVVKVELPDVVSYCVAKLDKSVANFKVLERLNEKEKTMVVSATDIGACHKMLVTPCS